MTPIKFTIKNGVTYFHYKASELIEFVRRGKKDGNVGLILTKRNGNILTYRGFGTIENPFTYIITLSISHLPFFDGEMPTDEQRLVPPKSFFTSENISFTVLDL
jgi:hypothetical protein